MRNHALMAKLCKISYIKHEHGGFNLSEISKELYKLNGSFRIVKVYNIKGTQALLLETNSLRVVVFRGSDEEIDWKNNRDFAMDPKRKIHRGFLRATENVIYDIRQDIKSMRTFKALYITGHSLGGACAVILANFFDKAGIKFNSVVTFGQPRVFGAALAVQITSRLKKRYYRYQNNNDAVPWVPPWFFGYKHAGQVKYITTDRRVIDNVPIMDQLRGLFLGTRENGLDFIEDHDINKYIAAL